MQYLRYVMLGIFLMISIPAMAMDLGTAKSRGLVGETPSGYLAAVSATTPEIKKLVDSINAKRKAQYQAVAKKNGTSLQAVEQLAGKKAIEKSTPGHFVKIGGAWKKK